MGIADDEIVHYQGEGGGVGVVAEEHGCGGFREAVLDEEGDKAKLGQEARLGEARDSLEDIAKKKRYMYILISPREQVHTYHRLPWIHPLHPTKISLCL